MNIVQALPEDAEEILALQKLAYQSEAALCGDSNIPPLLQTLSELRDEFGISQVLKAVLGERIVGSVRAYEKEGNCFIGKLIVHPDFQNQGMGKALMGKMEEAFPESRRFELFTGEKSLKNIRLYEKLGYVIFKTQKVTENLCFVFLEKPNQAK